MLPQRFSVIAEEKDQAGIVELSTLQPRDETSQFVIGVGDLSVIRMSFVLRAKRLRRIVRTMRIVQVQPEEEWPLRMFLQPCKPPIDAFTCATFYESEIAVGECFWGERIIIEIESACQSPTSVEHERADDRSGCVSVLLKCLRDGAELLVEGRTREILHSVLKRISASQDYGVRGPRQRNLRDGSL